MLHRWKPDVFAFFSFPLISSTKKMFRNWSWLLGTNNPLKKIFGGPQLRARSDQGMNLPAVIAFGVGIGIYTFQPALKEAADVVTKEQETKKE